MEKPKSSCKGRPPHDEWDGFLQIRNSKGRIVGSECEKCGVGWARKDGPFLKNHRENLCGKKRTQKSILAADSSKNNLKRKSTESDYSIEEEKENAVNSLNDNCDVSQSNRPMVSTIKSFNDNCDVSQPKRPSVSTPKKQTEIDVLYFNYLMDLEVDFNSVNLQSSKAFFNALGYKTPTEQDLKGKLLQMSLLQCEKELTGVMLVFTKTERLENNDVQLYAFSTMVTTTGSFVFVNFFCKIDDEDVIYTEFKEFVSNSIITAYTRFKKLVSYIQHNSPIDFAFSQKFNFSFEGENFELDIAIMYCLSKLFYALRKDHPVVERCDAEMVEWLNLYYKNVENLKKECVHLNLSDATLKMLKFLSTHDSEKLNVKSVFETYMSPAAYSSCFFNPRYKNEYDTFQEDKKVEEFLVTVLPDEALSIYTDYQLEIEHFQFLFNTVKDNPSKFWKAAGLKYSKNVCVMVHELLTLTGFLPSVSDNLWKNLKKLSAVEDETTRIVRMQLAINEMFKF